MRRKGEKDQRRGAEVSQSSQRERERGRGREELQRRGAEGAQSSQRGIGKEEKHESSRISVYRSLTLPALTERRVCVRCDIIFLRPVSTRRARELSEPRCVGLKDEHDACTQARLLRRAARGVRTGRVMDRADGRCYPPHAACGLDGFCELCVDLFSSPLLFL